MTDQMLEDKYNELGKAHVEAMNRIESQAKIIAELKVLIIEAIPFMDVEFMEGLDVMDEDDIDSCNDWMKRAKDVEERVKGMEE